MALFNEPVTEAENETGITHGLASSFKATKNVAKSEPLKQAFASQGEKLKAGTKLLNYGGHTDFSMSSDDPIDSLMQITPEQLNIEKLKTIQESTDIVNAYKEYCAGELTRLTKEFAKKFESDNRDSAYSSFSGIIAWIYSAYSVVQQYGEVSETDFKEFLLKNVFPESIEDPEAVKKMIQMRLKYSEGLKISLEIMLKNNYKLLGIGESEADALIEKLKANGGTEAIAKIKELFIKNKEKFIRRGGTMIDFRPVGGGVVYSTEDDLMDMNKLYSIDKFILRALNYDVIVYCHGTEDMKEEWSQEEIKKYSTQYNDKIRLIKQKLQHVYNTYKNIKFESNSHELESLLLLTRVMDSPSVITASPLKLTSKYQWDKVVKPLKTNTFYKRKASIIKKLASQSDMARASNELKYFMQKFNISTEAEKNILFAFLYYFKSKKDANLALKLTNDLVDKYEHGLQEIIDDPPYDMLTTYWYTQPVKTENGGPYTEVNELVRQIIKEGAKRILLVQCNPGHYELADDIKKNHPDVYIRHSMNVTMVESYEDINDPIMKPLIESKEYLRNFCIENDIDFDDDVALESAYNYFTTDIESDNEIITEGKVLTVLKTIVVNIGKAIAWLWKKAIEIAIDIYRKIKGLITGNPYKKIKTSKDIKVTAAVVESAKIVERSVKDKDELENFILQACGKITTEINKRSREQTKMADDLKRMIETGKIVKESSGPSKDMYYYISGSKSNNGLFGSKTRIYKEIDLAVASLPAHMTAACNYHVFAVSADQVKQAPTGSLQWVDLYGNIDSKYIGTIKINPNKYSKILTDSGKGYNFIYKMWDYTWVNKHKDSVVTESFSLDTTYFNEISKNMSIINDYLGDILI